MKINEGGPKSSFGPEADIQEGIRQMEVGRAQEIAAILNSTGNDSEKFYALYPIIKIGRAHV